MSRLNVDVESATKEVQLVRGVIRQLQGTLRSERKLMEKIKHDPAQKAVVGARITQLEDGIRAQQERRDKLVKKMAPDQQILAGWAKKHQEEKPVGRGVKVEGAVEAMDVEESLAATGSVDKGERGAGDNGQTLVATRDGVSGIQGIALTPPGAAGMQKKGVKREAESINLFNIDETGGDDRSPKMIKTNGGGRVAA